MKIKIKQLSNNATIPTYGSGNAACLDLYANLQDQQSMIEIQPHETKKVGCGFAFEIPENYCGLIFARSGLATNYGLRPANCVGVADADYRGEYIVAVHNDSNNVRFIHQNDRIAQVMFIPINRIDDLEVVDELSETDRGYNGFGSTGR